MAKSHSVTHTQVLNLLPLFELFTTSYITTLILYLHLLNFTFSILITPSDTENFHRMIRILQILWFPIMTVFNLSLTYLM